jgi:deazaflavin-dependent oxidoreductase (nitroreductase family)
MAAARDWNAGIIEEFRANQGKVGGMFEGRPLLLLHHKGAKSGTVRVNPLAYQVLEDGNLAVFASKGGAPTNPDWFHNVQANPEVTVELGTETFGARVRIPDEEERDRIWNRMKEIAPGFAEYEKKTTRKIPVVILERVG